MQTGIQFVNDGGVEKHVELRLAVDGGQRVVGREEARHLELVFDLLCNLPHLVSLAVDQHHVSSFNMSEQLHNTLRVSMGRETHIVDAHLDFDVLAIQVDLLLAREHAVANSAWHAVARDDHSVLLVTCPLFENLEGEAAMEHAWSGEEHHRVVGFNKRVVELRDVLEVEHVLFDECLFDLFISPVNE